MFRGTYAAKIDEKGRLKIPNALRAELEKAHGRELFVTSLTGEYVRLYPMPVWLAREKKFLEQPSEDPSIVRYLQHINYWGQPAEIDAQGRVVIHARLRERASISGDVDVSGQIDRLEVWNPGRLPATLSIEQLTRPHASIPRNPLLAEPMFLARYVEKAGSGILDMIALRREAGLPAPGFRQDGGKLVPDAVAAEAAEAPVEETEQDTGQVTGQVDIVEEELSAEVQRLLRDHWRDGT